MKDLIDRQAAIDALRNNRMLPLGEHPAYNRAMRDSEKVIRNVPSAQPEIIRCKDCRHNHDCNIQYHAQAGEEFYCGVAERKIDGKNQN